MGFNGTSWKNFALKLITQSDHPRIFEHLRSSYYYDELFNKLLGTAPDYLDDQDSYCAWALNRGDNLCFLALDESNQIAAVCMAIVETKDMNYSSLGRHKSKEMTTLVKALAIVDEKGNLAERFKVEKWVDCFIVSVAREYRNQGLMTAMLERLINVLKNKEFSLAVLLATSPFSIKICEKLGFNRVTRIHLSDMTDNGRNKLFPNATMEHFVSVMCLKLDE